MLKVGVNQMLKVGDKLNVKCRRLNQVLKVGVLNQMLCFGAKSS